MNKIQWERNSQKLLEFPGLHYTKLSYTDHLECGTHEATHPFLKNCVIFRTPLLLVQIQILCQFVSSLFNDFFLTVLYCIYVRSEYSVALCDMKHDVTS